MEDIVIKAAKKILKKHDDGGKNGGGPMKLKELTKLVQEKIASKQDGSGNEQQPSTALSLQNVKDTIISSSKFQVDDKIVTLKKSSKDKKKKRNRSDDEPNSLQNLPMTTPDGGDEMESSSSPKKKKKSSNKKDSTSSAIDCIPFDTESVRGWRETNKIVIMHCDDHQETDKVQQLNENESYFPYTTFQDQACVESIAPALLHHCVKKCGFTKPSPIQAQAWPIMTTRYNTKSQKQQTSDIVGIAETGSGKTLAFAVPALSAMLKENEQQSSNNKGTKRFPRLLVLAPTRELAMQSDQVLQEFGAVVGLTSLVVYGGVPKHTQVTLLKQRTIDCLVATPGRLKDLMYDGVVDLSHVNHLVLDEADRMLDMGFEEDVRNIISQCKSKELGRQTAMFSATWPAAIRKIALEYMVDPIRVYVGFEAIVGSNGTSAVDDSLSANTRVQQIVEVIDDRQRDARLRTLLKQVHTGKHQKDRVLVFALYKKEAERLEQSLKRDGWDCCSIHGNKNQMARTEALAQFKDGTCPLLVATDVAARGLDIPNVEVVINYTFPLTIEDYVHRIGRTGRAGKNGISYTFFQPSDKSHAGELQQVLKQVNQPIPEALLKFGSTIKKKEHKLYGNFGPRSDIPMKNPTKIKFDSDDDE